MLKVLSFLKRREDFSLPAFSEYWRTVHKAHAMTLVEAGFIAGYVQNHRVRDAAEDLPGLPLMADGSPELWVERAEDLARLVASPEYREGAGPDEANFISLPTIAAVARERIVVDGPVPPGAVKLMLVVRRANGVPAGDFAARWLTGAPLASPAGRGAVRVSRHATLGDDQPFDGVELSWWADEAALRAAWAARNADVFAGLVAPASLRGLVVREEIVVAVPQREAPSSEAARAAAA